MPSFIVFINFLATWKTGRAGSSTDVEQSQSLVTPYRIKGMTRWNITSKFCAGIYDFCEFLSSATICSGLLTNLKEVVGFASHGTHLGHGHLFSGEIWVHQVSKCIRSPWHETSLCLQPCSDAESWLHKLQQKAGKHESQRKQRSKQREHKTHHPPILGGM